MMGDGEYPEGYGGSFTQQGYSVGSASFSYQPAPAEPKVEPWEIHNVEAEAALLGGVMIANNMIPLVAERVAPEDFWEPLHGRVFKAILRLHDRDIAANPIYLRPIFQNDPDMKELGGPGYLAQLTGSGAGIIGLIDFADQIAMLSVRRVTAAAMRDGLLAMADVSAEVGIENVDDVLSEVQDTAYAAMARAMPMKPRSIATMVRRVAERHAEISEAGEPIGASCRSIVDLDKILGPLEAGTYNVIGGRPGMCKTTLACSAAWGYAAGGTPVEYFHAEMTEDQMAMRQAADLSHAMRTPIRHDAIRKAALSGRERDDLDAVAVMAETLPINFTATGACDIRRVEAAVARARLRWARAGRKLGVVVLDYIQKYGATDARGRMVTDPTEAASIVSATCARIAQRQEVAVIALAQLSRAVEDRKDKRPQMNDLKQSGRIEEDADSVTLLFREEYYWVKDRPKKDPLSKEYQDWETHLRCIEGKVELIGEKNRHGKPRTRTVKFFAPYYAIRSGDFAEGDAVLAPGLFDEDDAAEIASWETKR